MQLIVPVGSPVFPLSPPGNLCRFFEGYCGRCNHRGAGKRQSLEVANRLHSFNRAAEFWVGNSRGTNRNDFIRHELLQVHPRLHLLTGAITDFRQNPLKTRSSGRLKRRRAPRPSSESMMTVPSAAVPAVSAAPPAIIAMPPRPIVASPAVAVVARANVFDGC